MSGASDPTGPSWIDVASAADVPSGTGRVVNADGRLVAVFNTDGAYHAIDNQCPHRGGPLGKGPVSDGVVMCPWHSWSFDVRTGVNVDTGRIRVECFPVAVRDGRILVRVDGSARDS